MKQVHALDCSDVQVINKAIRSHASDAGIAVTIVDSHGELMSFFRTDNCPLSAIVISQNKAFSAVRDRQPSGTLKENSRKFDFGINELGDSRFTGLAGGVPISVDGEFIGAVAVSGLAQEDDEKLAQVGIDAFLAAI